MTTAPPYIHPQAPAPRATGGLLALGIVSIVYSALFRLCCGFVGFMSSLGKLFLSSDAFQNIANMSELEGMPEMEMFLSPQMQSYNVINGFVMLFLGFGMLAGGIGLIRLKLWGRSISLAVAGAEVAWAIVSFAINIFFVYPAMNQMVGEGSPAGPQMIWSIVGGAIGTFMTLVFPVVLLVCLNLGSIKEQFGISANSSFQL